ncbi:MAG: flagellar hook basal-body protein [Bryobacteraceae bacterium]|nr:flagellar hook basal-body protein [Bryobacteraceae bacterium]
MDVLSTAAASGMRARIDVLELLANNLANAGTAGYKSDREFYSLFLSEEAAGVDRDPARMPVVEGRWTDFSQGVLKLTGNPLDLALSGEGFFVVQAPSGPLYTRNGAFRISKAGRLETTEGYPVATASGRPWNLDPAAPIEVSAEGIVRQAGVEMDRLQIVRFDQPQGLSKRDGTYFQWLTPTPPQPLASQAEVRQGHMEASNTGGAEVAVRLVNVMRQFEMLQKALTLGGEMNRRAVEEVARV